jgi:two-component system KDP operon response regulator KdpE
MGEHPAAPTVLVVDDDPHLLRTLEITLRARRYDVRLAPSAGAAVAAATAHPPDLVVVDLGLPDLDGVELVRRLRTWTSVPILVLSGRSDSADKVDALDAGADDYVTKPFETDELLARLRALARRTGPSDDQPVVQVGRASVDLVSRRVTVQGRDVRLTPTEWRLLEVLVRHPGELLSQGTLLVDVWGPGYESAQGNLRLYMSQLRKKLEPDPAHPRHLLNEPGLGYRFDPG